MLSYPPSSTSHLHVMENCCLLLVFSDVCLISIHPSSAGPNWSTFCLSSLFELIALALLLMRVCVFFQALPCWRSLCWCLPGWASFRRLCTRNTGNTPRKRSSTTWAGSFISLLSTQPKSNSSGGLKHHSTRCFLCSTAYLCPASCCSSPTSTATASSSAAAVSLTFRL